MSEEMKDKIMEIHGYICGPRLYKYKGWFFEIHQFCGPWPLKKDGELRKRAGRIWWKIWGEFDKLTDKQKSKYCVGGGCIRF